MDSILNSTPFTYMTIRVPAVKEELKITRDKISIGEIKELVYNYFEIPIDEQEVHLTRRGDLNDDSEQRTDDSDDISPEIYQSATILIVYHTVTLPLDDKVINLKYTWNSTLEDLNEILQKPRSTRYMLDGVILSLDLYMDEVMELLKRSESGMLISL